jgi:hypothetical protein
VFAQAAELAGVGAALYPLALLTAALYLASTRPGRMMVVFVLGGTVAVTVIGTAMLIAIRAAGLSLPAHHSARYGLRLALGIVALVAAVVIWRRKAKPPDPAKASKPSLITRLSAEPKALTAFAAGILVFGPGVAFIAAVQVVATAKASLLATIAAMAMIIVITLTLAWLPLVTYLIAPRVTTNALRQFEAWLKRYRKAVLAGALGVIGVILVIQGAVGLA